MKKIITLLAVFAAVTSLNASSSDNTQYTVPVTIYASSSEGNYQIGHTTLDFTKQDVESGKVFSNLRQETQRQLQKAVNSLPRGDVSLDITLLAALRKGFITAEQERSYPHFLNAVKSVKVLREPKAGEKGSFEFTV